MLLITYSEIKIVIEICYHGSDMQVESFVQDALSKVLSHLLCLDTINVGCFSSDDIRYLFDFIPIVRHALVVIYT